MSIFTVKLSTDPEHCAKLLFKELKYQAQKTNEPDLSNIIRLGKPLPANSLKHQLSLAAVQYSKRKKQKESKSTQSALERIELNN